MKKGINKINTNEEKEQTVEIIISDIKMYLNQQNMNQYLRT